MARVLKLYHVGTGLSDSGEDIANYSGKNVIAKDAEEAIRKAKKTFVRGEYAESAKVIGTIDLQ
jgi:1,2-phenylacetyl-CoA epoxidase PaaB subunit